MPELTEAEAVARCRKGQDPDHSAFRSIYERHRDEVLAFLGRLIDDRALVDDAAQDTFVRLYRGLKGFDSSRPVRPYVLAIARNVAMDVLRSRAKSKATEELLAREGTAAPADEVAATREHGAAVEDALAALDPQHRSLLLLRHAHELSQDELAEAFDCTSRTVRNRLRVASALLERELVRRGVIPAIEEEPS